MFQDLLDKGFIRFNPRTYDLDKDYVLKKLAVDKEKIVMILEKKRKLKSLTSDDKNEIRILKKLEKSLTSICTDFDKLTEFPDPKLAEQLKTMADEYKYICNVMGNLDVAFLDVGEYYAFIPKDENESNATSMYPELKEKLLSGIEKFHSLCKSNFFKIKIEEVNNVHKTLVGELLLGHALFKKQLLVNEAKNKLEEIKSDLNLKKDDITEIFLQNFNAKKQEILRLEAVYEAEAQEQKKSKEIFDKYVEKRNLFNKEYNPLEVNVYDRIKKLNDFIILIDQEKLAFKDLYKEKNNPTTFDEEYKSFQKKLKQANLFAEKERHAIIGKIDSYLEQNKDFATKNSLPDKSQVEYIEIKEQLTALKKEKEITLKMLEEYCEKIESHSPGWNIRELFVSLENVIFVKKPVIHVENKNAEPLYQALLGLYEHGDKLTENKDPKNPKFALYGKVTCHLAADLDRKAHDFFDNTENLKDKRKVDLFKKEFEKLLNCKNDVMKIHRREWLKKIADISKALFLICSVIGLGVYKIKTGKSPFLLFKQHGTNRQSRIEKVNVEVNRLLAVKKIKG